MKCYLLLVMLGMGYLSQAQSNEEIPLDTIPDSLNRKFTLGFQVGSSYTKFYNGANPERSSVLANGRGVRLGIHIDYPLNNIVSIIPSTELNFNNSKVTFRDEENVPYESCMSPVVFHFATYLKLKLPNQKFSPYIIVGPDLRVPMAANEPSGRNYGYSRDVAADAGAGLWFRVGSVSISPEVRYSYGFKSISRDPLIGPAYHHQLFFGIRISG